MLPKPVLVLLKTTTENPLVEYVVAKDCHIRVTPAMLKKAGLEGEHLDIDCGDGWSAA